MSRTSPIISGVSEVKPGAPCCCSSKLHVAGMVPGEEMVAETMVGSDTPKTTPGTGVIVIGVIGSGACGTRTKVPAGQAMASTVRDVTVMVLPRVQAGNFDAKISNVS